MDFETTILAVVIAGITLAFIIIQFFQHPEKTTSESEKAHINGAQKQQKGQWGPGKTLNLLKEVEKDVKHK